MRPSPIAHAARMLQGLLWEVKAKLPLKAKKKVFSRECGQTDAGRRETVYLRACGLIASGLGFKPIFSLGHFTLPIPMPAAARSVL